MTSISLTPAPALPLWRVAKVAGLFLTAVLLAALLLWPALTLHVLWDMVIPLLPAVFLVNPVIWRNVCPLATLNSATGSRWGSRTLERKDARIAWTIGIVLLAIMVPARRFLFNTDGVALSATIIAVAGLALLAGAFFTRRGGFCNGICPVLPVEKLYGQYPLARVGTSRCLTCSVCTPNACIELAQNKTTAQTLGPNRRRRSWLISPFGVFAAAFPGFIIGYFTMENGSLFTAPEVYVHVLAYAAISYVIVAAAVLLFGSSPSVALPVLGGTSLGLYYWYAAPALAKAYGGEDLAAVIIRGAAIALVIAWLWRASRGSQGRAAFHS
jgi:hypothetical protein